MTFSAPKQNRNNYIYMESEYTAELTSLTAAFWIKIPSSADEFTLISYAVPSQVNEFTIHFGTAGIWVYVSGNNRYDGVILFFLEIQ